MTRKYKKRKYKKRKPVEQNSTVSAVEPMNYISIFPKTKKEREWYDKGQENGQHKNYDRIQDLESKLADLEKNRDNQRFQAITDMIRASASHQEGCTKLIMCAEKLMQQKGH